MVEMLVEDSAEMGRQNGPVTCHVSRGSARPQCGFASRRTFCLQCHALMYSHEENGSLIVSNQFLCASEWLVHYLTHYLKNWELLTSPKNCCKIPFSMTLSTSMGQKKEHSVNF